MKNNKEQNFEKIKKIYNKIKEIWKNPRKRAGIKLGGYLIFFLVIIIAARIGVNIKPTKTTTSNNDNNEQISETVESYRDKQKLLLENNHNINYEIKIDNITYKINGILKENLIEGYLEETTGIKKIKIKDNVLYEIKEIETPLEYNIDYNKIDLNYIIKILEQNNAYIDNKNNLKSYQYAININEIENKIIVYTNDEIIYKITISDINSEYILNFDN